MEGVIGFCVGVGVVVLASLTAGFLTESVSKKSNGADAIIYHEEYLSSPLLEAIIEVESGGKPGAVGDNGLAVGILQIHPVMVRDCNRIVGHEKYSVNDRLDPEKSKEMFRAYSDHYADHYSDWTDQGIARRWNGGPTGHTKEATRAYWKMVEAALARIAG